MHAAHHTNTFHKRIDSTKSPVSSKASHSKASFLFKKSWTKRSKVEFDEGVKAQQQQRSSVVTDSPMTAKPTKVSSYLKGKEYDKARKNNNHKFSTDKSNDGRAPADKTPDKL